MRRAPALAALALALLGTAAGCQTVDLGTPPADVNACQPGQQYFASTVWPMYLGMGWPANDPSPKHCFDSSCHGAGTRTAMTLTDITAMLPLPPPPAPIPQAVMDDYTQASQQMNCSDVPDSRLLIFPENIQVHGGGQLIDPNSMEAQTILKVLETWITSP